MNKAGKTIIILVSIMLASALVGALFFFSSGVFDFNYGYVTGANAKNLSVEVENFLSSRFISGGCNAGIINQTITGSLANVSNLKINSISTDLVITSANVSKATFNLYGTGCEHKLVSLENQSNLEVYIKYPIYRSWFSGVNTHLKLNVVLPLNYSKDFVVNSVSGEVKYLGSNLNSCEIYSVSGDLDLQNVYCKNEYLKTTSGEVHLNNGNLGNVKTISGDVNLNNVLIDKDSSIQTVSGEVNILPLSASNFAVNYKTVSGDFSGEKIFGSGDNDLYVKTTSGDLRIK